MKKMLTGLTVVLVVGVLLGYGITWVTQQQQEVVEEAPVAVIEQLPERSVQLYFTAPEGTFLIAETAMIPGCEEERDCIAGLVNALIAGPQAGNLPVLPSQSAVLGVDIENDLVRVNLSQQTVDFHPGGSLSELLSIYSIANSLNENFPYIRQVQLLIDGEPKQTLKGHVRIDQPVYADHAYNQPPGDDDTEPTLDAEGGQGLSIDRLIEEAVPDEKN